LVSSSLCNGRARLGHATRKCTSNPMVLLSRVWRGYTEVGWSTPLGSPTSLFHLAPAISERRPPCRQHYKMFECAVYSRYLFPGPMLEKYAEMRKQLRNAYLSLLDYPLAVEENWPIEIVHPENMPEICPSKIQVFFCLECPRGRGSCGNFAIRTLSAATPQAYSIRAQTPPKHFWV
jgi:hypothetical protein